MFNFYHFSEPNLPKSFYVWHYVYLHGKAEDHNAKQVPNVEEPDAPDLVVADQPMPTKPGEYPAKLYGMDVIAVIDYHPIMKKLMAGRCAAVNDVEGLAHARDVKNWG